MGRRAGTPYINHPPSVASRLRRSLLVTPNIFITQLPPPPPFFLANDANVRKSKMSLFCYRSTIETWKTSTSNSSTARGSSSTTATSWRMAQRCTSGIWQCVQLTVMYIYWLVAICGTLLDTPTINTNVMWPRCCCFVCLFVLFVVAFCLFVLLLDCWFCCCSCWFFCWFFWGGGKISLRMCAVNPIKLLY